MIVTTFLQLSKPLLDLLQGLLFGKNLSWHVECPQFRQARLAVIVLSGKMPPNTLMIPRVVLEAQLQGKAAHACGI